MISQNVDCGREGERRGEEERQKNKEREGKKEMSIFFPFLFLFSFPFSPFLPRRNRDIMFLVRIAVINILPACVARSAVLLHHKQGIA